VSVDHVLITPDWKPLTSLLEDVLTRLVDDLAPQRPVEASITVRHRAARGEYALVRLASVGGGAEFVDAQLERLEGPVPDAVASGEPVLSPDVRTDPRWPGLTSAPNSDGGAGGDQACARVRGIAALPGEWATAATSESVIRVLSVARCCGLTCRGARIALCLCGNRPLRACDVCQGELADRQLSVAAMRRWLERGTAALS
jgi:hypothetical protein